MTPIELFGLLRHRFEAQMLAYTRTAVMRRENVGRKDGQTATSVTRDAEENLTKGGGYSTREATGDMSVRYFNELFGRPDPASVADLTATAVAKLGALDTAVRASTARWGPTAAMATRHASVNPNEERTLQAIEAKDTPTDVANAVTALEVFADAELGIKPPKAATVVANVRAKLASAPVTITVPGAAVFGGGVPKGSQTQYRAATQQRQMASESDVFGTDDAGEVVEHTGKYADPVFVDERGEDYLRFRVWKDRLMSQNMGLAPSEMPKFGALNLNWDINYGTSSTAKPTDLSAAKQALLQKDWATMTTAEKKARTKVPKLAGENYYGNVHLVLKDEVRQQRRVVFTATDHGAPHADPLMALNDARLGRWLTNLKSGPDKALLFQAFNAAGANPANVLMDALNLEAQVYGQVDLAVDVAAIYVAPYTPKKVRENAKKFCKKHGIQFHAITPDDPKLVNAALQGLGPSVVKNAIG
jgi:hypothetical protein